MRCSTKKHDINESLLKEISMRIMDYDLVVVIDGKPLEECIEECTGATWVLAPKGKEFGLFIYNNSNRRILVVPMIDGLSVMDGKPGNIQSGGYILGAYKGGIIPGWRIDSETVAAFKFDSANKGMSFFAKKNSRDIGTIQCAIYPEKSYPKYRPAYVPPIVPPVVSEGNNISAGGSGASMAVELPPDCGGRYYRSVEPPPPPKTAPPSAAGRGLASLFKNSQQENNEMVAVGFGSSSKHVISEEKFSQESDKSLCVLSIRYDTQAHIAARGITLVSKAAICDRAFLQGADAMLEQRYNDAVAAFTKVTKVRPEVEIGWESLVLACNLSGNRNGELHATSMLAQLKRNDAHLWKVLGVHYLSHEAWTDAVSAFDKYNELEKDESDSWNCLGYALAKAGQIDESWYCCNKAIELDPQSYNAWDSLGVMHLAAGRLEEASAAFKKATAIKPSFAEAWENLWITYKKMNRSDDALCALNRLGEIDHLRAEKVRYRS